MSKTSVLAIVNSSSQAENIVDRLRAGGFSGSDISVLFPDKRSNQDFAHEKHTKAPEGATAGVGAGGIIGGALGWLAGIGLIAIPGVGPLIAAGPIMAALSGAAVGGLVGGVAGALIGLGVPEFEAKRYEGKIREGNILISVHTEKHEEVSRVKEIFTQGGATDISSTGESSVPAAKYGKKRDAPASGRGSARSSSDRADIV
jgi:hypothetical protein